jgi:hypothetical protein
MPENEYKHSYYSTLIEFLLDVISVCSQREVQFFTAKTLYTKLLKSLDIGFPPRTASELYAFPEMYVALRKQLLRNYCKLFHWSQDRS